MRKAQKRELGRQRQAINREESRLSGLMAQERDQKKRDEQHQAALIARDKRSKKEIPENEGSSNLAQEKKARVQQKLAEKGNEEALLEAIFAGSSKHPNLKEVGKEYFQHDAELDLSSVDC